MNEPNNPNNLGAGFEVETGLEPEQNTPKSKAKKSNELKQNFNAVFGHGICKLSLIFVGISVCVVLAFGYRGMTKTPSVNKSGSEMQVPLPPNAKVSIDPVSEKEAQRRAERSAVEAQMALSKGETYQAGFDPNIMNGQQSRSNADSYLSFNLPDDRASTQTSQQFVIGAGRPASTMPTQISNNYSTQSQENQRLEREYLQALAERDKYVSRMQNQVLTQAEKLFGDQGGDNLNNIGSYSTVSYVAEKKQQTPAASANSNTSVTKTENNTLGDPGGKLLIKTGNLMYATLDSEVNTDAGHDVFATIRGGTWDGSKLIGRLEQGPNNIVIRFSVLAPQDERPTMRIDAVALREEDASTGAADKIDHHTFARYTSLAVASLLSGYGRAYATTPGTTVVSPGGVVTQTTTEPTDRQIFGSAVGEMGSNMASEIRQGFNRPTTYSTPANKGFGLFFLQDVFEQGQR